jgi:NhaP-type Na+/H+ or K+/H+ antiporter
MGIFRRQILQILLLAFPAMIMASGLTALCIYALAPPSWTFWVPWLIGIIASATDPVAVVALLKELGKSKPHPDL